MKIKNTTAETAKHNCRKIGQLDSSNFAYCVRRTSKKTTAETAKNNYQTSEKELPSKNNCQK